MIHQYQNNGYNIVLDVNSGCVHVVDEPGYEVIACLNRMNENQTVQTLKEESTWNQLKDELEGKYSEEELRDILDDVTELTACHTYSLHLQISLICCVRKSDFLLYKKSCMLTDRMSGILRIRPSLLYCSESVYSMF